LTKDRGNTFDVSDFARAFAEALDLRGFADAFAAGFRHGANLIARQIHRAGAAVHAPARFAGRHPSAEVELDRVLVTVLITAIIDSTKRVAEIGDRDWLDLLDRHDEVTRYQIKRFGGREVGNRGDGFVGIFDSPARAIRCAAAIADTIAPLGIAVRSGIHIGEVHLRREEISGLAVHTAAGIAATARPGEACVSKTVRDLVAGSGLVFEDRGIHRLRGLPEKIQLYAVRAAAADQTADVGVTTRSDLRRG
jgi:class 3 adenylate cyclase